MTTELPQRKHPRLRRKIYSDPSQAFSITTCTAKGRKLFYKSAFADHTFETVKNYLADRSRLFAACLMPNHVHLLLMAKEINLIDLIGSWKRYVSRMATQHNLNKPVWQASFYDHAIRKDDNLQKLVINAAGLGNPALRRH
jgi:REP element-mobilizing transposase RayT